MGKRIEYIDAMRGLAMLLVVVGHVFVFSFKDMDHILFRILSANLEVPLFFMVSGFFMKMPTHGQLPYFRKKAFLLCIPATLFLTVYAWAYDYNYFSVWVDSYKYGYWFTFSLFEFIVLYVVLKYIAKKMRLGSSPSHLLLLIAGIIALGVSVWCARREGNFSIIPLLNLIQFKYFIYFVLGAILAERKLLQHSSNIAGTKIGG